MKYAYIFDFDGVLVETMEAHYICNKIALEESGIPIDKKKYFSQAGMTGPEQITFFAKKAGKQIDEGLVEMIYRRKKELYKDHIGDIKVIESNLSLLEVLRLQKVPVAIATGCSMASLLPVVKKFNIRADVFVTSEDVEKGKPAPDLFLLAAERLGVPARHCVVVEDSDVGIEAANCARMQSFRFYGNHKKL